MSKKNNKESVANNQSETLNMLLVPISIVLAGVLITVSVLYGASVILDRDQLVTKTTLRTTLRDELSNLNLSGNPTQPSPKPTPVIVAESQLSSLVSTQGIVMGDKNSKLKFVEFSDPSCPFCSLASGNPKFLNSYPGYIPPVPEIKKLVQEGKASYTWVYLPTHGNGELAAQAIYCANEKGKFWEVHDKLMVGDGYDLIENQIKNDTSKVGTLSDYLKDIVDPSFINSCVSSGKYKDVLNKDITVATEWKANATPTFFVNIEQVNGSNFSDFSSLIQKYQ